MGVSYMQEVSKGFLADISKMAEELKDFSADMDKRRDDIFSEIEAFIRRSAAIAGADKGVQPLATGKSKSAVGKMAKTKKRRVGKKAVNSANPVNPVDRAKEEAMRTIREMIDSWAKKMVQNKKGITFMHKHEKYLVLMVFGAVKAGKSSLGNFFAGRDFLDAPFDNAYKHTNLARFETEDCKRDFGGIEKDEKGREWFAQGFTDTTGNIQYFTVSGLRWVDSPGTGAVAKDTDKNDGRTMDEMVEEYIPYTDLCIFLMNSSEPGLQSDMQYIRKLNKENQTALIVITKSDINDEDEDEDGNLIDCWTAKSPETRKAQEDHICQQIAESCEEVSPDKYSAISVSTFLAQHAIKDQDDKKFKESNLDGLMNYIRDKASHNVVELKQRKPKETLNAFIDSIIDDVESEHSIVGLRKKIKDMMQSIAASQKEIDKKKSIIQQSLKAKVSSSLNAIWRELESQVSHNGEAITGDAVAHRLMTELQPMLHREINEAIGEVIQGYKSKVLSPIEVSIDMDIQKEYKTVSTSYKEVDYVVRDPEGWWQKLRSMLGKTYYRRVVRNRVKTSQVDMGTNMSEFISKVGPAVEDTMAQYVTSNLEFIKRSYFQPQLDFGQTMLKELAELEETMTAYKYKLEA